MIEKKERAILLFSKLSSENNLYVKFLTHKDEILTGISFGASSKKKKNIYQIGYFFNVIINNKNTNFPNNISVFEFHRDSNYSHPIGEINCFYALNKCLDSSALQVEKNLGFEDYLPLNLKAGQYALLNTSIYKHGDILYQTRKTRVSMDFRFIPRNLLNENKSPFTKGIKFTSDSYFIDEKKMISL